MDEEVWDENASSTWAALVFDWDRYILAALWHIAVIPFYVATVCYRANYVPKNKVLQEPANTTLGMMRRLLRAGGWRSLYRGTFLMLIGTAYMLAMDEAFAYFVDTVAHADPEGLFVYLAEFAYITVVLLVYIPLDVLFCRTVVYPGTLQWCFPRAALSQVLTEDERRRPWRLYFIPGVVPATVIHILFLKVLTPISSDYTMSPFYDLGAFLAFGQHYDDDDDEPYIVRADVFLLIAHILWTCIVFTIVIPLNCVTTRLMVQRRPSLARSNTPRPLVTLRPCASSSDAEDIKPYTGAWDCFIKMAREEGWRSLTRGSLFTIFANPSFM